MIDAIQLPTLIDSHCHLQSLDLAEFNNNLDNVIAEAKACGVKQFLCVCVELSDVPVLYELASRYPSVNISIGVHPNTEMPEESHVEKLVSLATHPACIAIGETGLDYYRMEGTSVKKNQQARFRDHINAALTLSKPLIIHTREASEDTLSIMAEERASEIGGVMHCFTESWEVAQRALDLNFYISISGIVTFKNAIQVQEVAKKVPIERLLIETDSPYLAPVPFRGKQNHPALVKQVAEVISELRGMDYQTLASYTTSNFYRCFRLPRIG